jgi:transcriptional regulator with XRE-family HTH domain
MRPSKNPELIEALALEVKVRRDELGLSQEDLAGKMQMDRPYISMIEVARKQPTLSVLFRLAQGLDMTLASLMERVEKRYVRVQKARRAAAKQTSS